MVLGVEFLALRVFGCLVLFLCDLFVDFVGLSGIVDGWRLGLGFGF